MANSIYPLWKQALMREADLNKSLDQGGINPALGVYCSLLTIAGGYVYSDAHQFYTSLTNIVGTDRLITGGTVNGRVFDGDDAVFTNVPTGSIEGIALYRKNTGANSTWRLVLYEDTGIIGVPVSTNGGNIVITWNTQGIFGL